MTLKEVRLSIAILTELTKTPHKDIKNLCRNETYIHQEVLQAIADGAANSKALACEALKTLEIKFPRWPV